jgi:hypothetical protein
VRGGAGGTQVRQRAAKYWEPDTSGISTTTKKGLNTFDIVLPK